MSRLSTSARLLLGLGFLIFSLNYSEADFAAVTDRFLAATRAMGRDGWWWTDRASTNRSIRQQILCEMLACYWARARPAWHAR